MVANTTMENTCQDERHGWNHVKMRSDNSQRPHDSKSHDSEMKGKKTLWYSSIKWVSETTSTIYFGSFGMRFSVFFYLAQLLTLKFSTLKHEQVSGSATRNVSLRGKRVAWCSLLTKGWKRVNAWDICRTVSLSWLLSLFLEAFTTWWAYTCLS